MKKILFIVLSSLFLVNPVFADLATNNAIQTRIDSIGTRILNFNKIQKLF